MPSSPLSPNETARLDALRRYDILDTAPEDGFDRATRIAARWLDVPIALITFLDEDRQWFKSCVGLPFNETDRDVAFCAQNQDEDRLLVVEDALLDPRFANNALVIGPPYIRFYAGAPLVTPDHHILGSLCVIDTKPRTAASMDLTVLRDLADTVVTDLELRLKNKNLAERNQQIQELTRELNTDAERTHSQLSHLVHEELQQTLQATRMQLEMLSAEEHRSGASSLRLEQIRTGLDDALDRTETLSARFAPPVANQPLRETLDWLALRIQETHGLSVSVEGTPPSFPHDEGRVALLYRLVRELLFQVVRHTDLEEADVQLTEAQDHLHITLDVNHPLFLPPGAGQSGSKLARLRAQVDALGGHVHIQRHATTGTRVLIEMPHADWARGPQSVDPANGWSSPLSPQPPPPSAGAPPPQ